MGRGCARVLASDTVTSLIGFVRKGCEIMGYPEGAGSQQIRYGFYI